MRPFNLERALAGDPVVTRDGDSVGHIMLVPDIYNLSCPVLFVTEYGSWNVRKDGRLYSNKESSLDLFMGPVKKEGWVNLYSSFKGGVYTGRIYGTKEEAIKNKCNSTSSLATTKLEWEE